MRSGAALLGLLAAGTARAELQGDPDPALWRRYEVSTLVTSACATSTPLGTVYVHGLVEVTTELSLAGAPTVRKTGPNPLHEERWSWAVGANSTALQTAVASCGLQFVLTERLATADVPPCVAEASATYTGSTTLRTCWTVWGAGMAEQPPQAFPMNTGLLLQSCCDDKYLGLYFASEAGAKNAGKYYLVLRQVQWLSDLEGRRTLFADPAAEVGSKAAFVSLSNTAAHRPSLAGRRFKADAIPPDQNLLAD